nr:putative protein containing caspase domain protein [Virgibacillus halodenitrificans]
MKKALIVGINHYDHVPPLFGCVNDAHEVKAALERNSDGTVNFSTKLLTSDGSESSITRSDLRKNIQELFEGDSDCALLFFAGHGCLDSTGGYIIASDAESGDEGVPLNDVVTFANQSNARNRLIILDSCHSGIAGNRSGCMQTAEITEGVTILTASTANQYSSEENGSGIFTQLFVDALCGAASNLVGEITPGSIYAHIDQSLGPWEQRPVFKTNVTRFFSLRTVQPPIALPDLQRITELFPTPGFEFQLDPSFEPESDEPNTKNTERFAVLQRMNRVNLVTPIDTIHMYHAAMSGKSCKLTVLGEHYRKLVKNGMI